jgi:hypothetical protein
MRVAAAKAETNPSHPLPLAGYAGRLAPFLRIGRALEANVLCFEIEDGPDLCIVALDGLFASRELERLILERLEPPHPILMLIASHSHCAPSLDDLKPVLGIVDLNYLCEVADTVATTIVSAKTQVGDVALHYGVGSAGGAINRRRRWVSISKRFPMLSLRWVMAPNTKAPRYDAVQALVVGDDPASPSAVIWSWPCHAVSAPNKGVVDSDFPGAVRQLLRVHFSKPNLPVLYLPGFCGDIRPDVRGSKFSLSNLLRHSFLPITPFGPDSQESFEALSASTAQGLMSAVAASRPVSSDCAVTVTSTCLDLSTMLRPPQAVAVDVHRIDVGDVCFLLVGAEVCSPYYEKLGFDPSTPMFLSGYTGPVFGYLPTEKQRREGGYEASGFFPAFGLKGRFKPGVEDAFLAAVRRVGWLVK